MATNIHVSVVEDNARMREALRVVLEGMPGFGCASTHPSAEHALEHLAHAQPHIVLVDLILPKMNGIECIHGLKRKLPKLDVIVFTQFDNHEYLFDALKAGAVGYVLKSTPPSEVMDAIRVVHAGGSWMSPSIARKVLQHFQQLPGSRRGVDPGLLTPREVEILRLAHRGMKNHKIGAALGIQHETVRTHFKHIYEKLHVNTRMEATLKYFGLDAQNNGS